jgi:hypothetical protein
MCLCLLITAIVFYKGTENVDLTEINNDRTEVDVHASLARAENCGIVSCMAGHGGARSW